MKNYTLIDSTDSAEQFSKSLEFLLPGSLVKSKVLSPKTLKDLKTGKRRPEAVLDLHGMTINQAHHAVKSFLHRSHFFYSRRCVLIITGKGRKMPQRQAFDALPAGALRREVPLWLKSIDFKDQVSGISVAHPRDGGQGALYVYLRKKAVD